MFKKIFNFFRYIVISALVVLIFAFTYYSLSDSFPIDADIDAGESFYNMPENSVEVLVLGSSHAEYSFCPAFFFQDTGLYSYNLGTPCQPLSVSYTMLKDALKTQHPKLVILEVFTAIPLKKTCDDGITCYIVSAFNMTGEEKYETLKKLPQEKQDIYLNPFTSSHNEWRDDETDFNEIYEKSKETLFNCFKKPTTDIDKVSSTFGYVDIYSKLPKSNYWHATNKYIDTFASLLAEDINALNDIYDLCKENDIELLLYKTPIDSLDDENLTYLHRVWEWADERDVPYIDYVEKCRDLGLYMQIHLDSFHSYITGASIITNDLGNFVNQHYDFEHNAIDKLESKYRYGERRYVLSSLGGEYDATKYLKRLMNYDGPILIINGVSSNNQTFNSFMDSYNVPNYTIALIDRGELIESGETCIEIEYKGCEIYADFSHLEIDADIRSDISPFTIVVFSDDMTTHKIIETDATRMWKKGFNWYGE